MTPTIAGHSLVPDPLGRLACNCGRRWIDISGATQADVGQPGIAHVGTLTAGELDEIVAFRERRWEAGIGRAVEVVG